VVLLVVLNWVFVWPHASDFGNYQRRLASANEKLKNYRKTVAELPDLEKKISAYEDKGDIVETLDQGVNFLRTIQMQSAQSSVQLQDAGAHPPAPTTHSLWNRSRPSKCSPWRRIW